MAVLKKYTATFTPNVITSKQVVENGKTLVTEVEYTINAYETANSSNTVVLPNQYITFNLHKFIIELLSLIDQW